MLEKGFLLGLEASSRALHHSLTMLLKCFVHGFLLGIFFGVPVGFLNRVPFWFLSGIDKGAFKGSTRLLQFMRIQGS